MTETQQPDKIVDGNTQAIAMASLSMFESLLLSLLDNKILKKKEVYGLLSDASEAHRQRAAFGESSDLHLRVADVIELLRDGGNSTTSER